MGRSEGGAARPLRAGRATQRVAPTTSPCHKPLREPCVGDGSCSQESGSWAGARVVRRAPCVLGGRLSESPLPQPLPQAPTRTLCGGRFLLAGIRLVGRSAGGAARPLRAGRATQRVAPTTSPYGEPLREPCVWDGSCSQESGSWTRAPVVRRAPCVLGGRLSESPLPQAPTGSPYANPVWGTVPARRNPARGPERGWCGAPLACWEGDSASRPYHKPLPQAPATSPCHKPLPQATVPDDKVLRFLAGLGMTLHGLSRLQLSNCGHLPASGAASLLTVFGGRWYYVMSFVEPQCYEDNRTYRGYWQRKERSI